MNMDSLGQRPLEPKFYADAMHYYVKVCARLIELVIMSSVLWYWASPPSMFVWPPDKPLTLTYINLHLDTKRIGNNYKRLVTVAGSGAISSCHG
jgi:hypothetical protein